MFAFLHNWMLQRIKKNSQKIQPPSSIGFDKKNLVVDGGYFSIGGNWFLQALNATGFFLSLPPNVYAVVIYPDGSMHEMQAGLHAVPPGLYGLKYVSGQEHFLVTPPISEMTLDGEKLTLKLLIQYHVNNPVSILQIENPIPALTAYIETDIAAYIRAHDHDQIAESTNTNGNSGMFSFFNKRHLKRPPLSDTITITGIELQEITGDTAYVDMRRKQRLEQKQESIDREEEERQMELKRLAAQHQALVEKMKAEHKAEIDKLLAKTNNDSSEVSYTAYHPKEGSVESWHILLVYTHVLSAMQKVQADAKRFADQIKSPKETTSKSSTPILRGMELTIVPSCEGVTFNPERVSFKWMEDFHRADFRFKADQSLSGDAAKGSIDIYVGPLIIGTLKFAMLFNDKDAQPVPDHEEHAKMYGRDDVFISYSRKDSEIARTFKTVLEGTGLDVFLDVDDIRSGQLWEEELKRRIERAKIFQVFWSANYSQSENCKQEWEYALKQNKDEGYIRPVFWQKPLSPNPPEELNKFNFKYVELKV